MTRPKAHAPRPAYQLIFIADAGHGWLRVPLLEGLKYGTGYGFQDLTWAYLEEDCEAPAYLRDHPEATYTTVSEDGWSFVRNLPRLPDAELVQ